MKQHGKMITTGTIASHCHVTYNTVNNWIKQSKLVAYETPGGHHRIFIDDFQRFLKTYGLPPFADASPTIRKLLVVDDDVAIVDNISCFFHETGGYMCATALDGYDAGIQVTRFRPDMIILDLFMPKLDGFEVCRKIKADQATAHILVLAITGSTENSHHKQMLDCGADCLLVKPFTLKALHQEVERLFKQQAPHNKTPLGTR